MPDRISNSGDQVDHGARSGPVRQRFLASSHTLENVRRDFPEWHKGRAHYLLWAIDVDAAVVRERVACASAHLADLLLGGYRRGPHVTLALCGFARTESSQESSQKSSQKSSQESIQLLRFDDVGVAHIEAQAQALRLARVLPFAIDIGALDSFSSAPFFHVDAASGAIAALRAALASVPAAVAATDADWDRSKDESADYVAHVTVGLYGGAWPSAAVGMRLDGFDFGPRVRLAVDRISLMSYCAGDIGGPLTTLAHYHFDSAVLEWHSRQPFAL